MGEYQKAFYGLVMDTQLVDITKFNLIYSTITIVMQNAN